MLVSATAEFRPHPVPVASPVKTHDVNRNGLSNTHKSAGPAPDRRRFLCKRSARNKKTRKLPAPVVYEGEAVASGIYLPEYGVRVPWGISKEALYRLIPSSALHRTGNWPQLRFTLLGVRALYGFNFVSSEGRLNAIRFDGCTPRRRTYRRAALRFIAALGVPNFVDHSLQGHQAWRYGETFVQHVAMRRAWREEGDNRVHLVHHEIWVYCCG